MDISEITDYLYVGAQPAPTDCADLGALNVGLVINMRAESKPHAAFSAPPLSVLWLRTFDIFLLPIRMRVLERGVRAAAPVIARGQKVLVHCHMGRHRSVAMAAAILIARGVTARAAMAQLAERRASADPYLWYIRRQIEKFERYWRERNPA
ncbi:MAG: dual specificity protein phosphatase family protein [Anaerolineales bacterium]|nr:dual specificity protein phosphatase family protein [Anaerolineales bacterium]